MPEEEQVTEFDLVSFRINIHVISFLYYNLRLFFFIFLDLGICSS